jgi:hypothetical protein
MTVFLLIFLIVYQVSPLPLDLFGTLLVVLLQALSAPVIEHDHLQSPLPRDESFRSLLQLNVSLNLWALGLATWMTAPLFRAWA